MTFTFFFTIPTNCNIFGKIFYAPSNKLILLTPKKTTSHLIQF